LLIMAVINHDTFHLLPIVRQGGPEYTSTHKNTLSRLP
jgi:hypothetical protein